MFKFLQKVTFFQISKFQAAAKAMKESGKEPWLEKISKGQKNQLWALYKQATEGDASQTSKGQQKPQENITQTASQKTKDEGIKESSAYDQQQYDAWNKYKGKSRSEAENEYVKLARDLLTKHNAEKYIKDF